MFEKFNIDEISNVINISYFCKWKPADRLSWCLDEESVDNEKDIACGDEDGPGRTGDVSDERL